jgi:hypothetical protein
LRQYPHNTDHKSPRLEIVVPTGGEILPDGTLLELIHDVAQPGGLALLKFDGTKTVVGSRIVHRGRTYVPLTLHPSVKRALRLPSSVCAFGSTAELFEELVAVTARFTDLDRHFRELLVAFVFASWLADLLPAPMNLLLWSPLAEHGAQVLLLLRCLCRLALALTGVDAGDLKALPDGLPATLLILRPGSSRRTRELLAAAGWRGFYTPRSGRLVEFLGAKALATDAPIDDPALHPLIVIPVAASRRQLPALDRRAQERVAKEFQPRLLRYRLQHRETANVAASAQAGSAGRESQLASGMRTCFSDAPQLIDRQVALLAEAEQGIDETRRADPRVALIELMWARCHEAGREQLHVGEIAFDLNKVLSLTGNRKLKERMVGGLLKSVGLRTLKLDRKGRGIKLDPPTRKLIHQLARVHEVPSAETSFAGCPECSQAQPAGV